MSKKRKGSLSFNNIENTTEDDQIDDTERPLENKTNLSINSVPNCSTSTTNENMVLIINQNSNSSINRVENEYKIIENGLALFFINIYSPN
jgi:hypothetical protein